MSSIGSAFSFLRIVCKDIEQANLVKEAIDKKYSEKFIAEISSAAQNEIELIFQDCDIYSDFDEVLVEFAKWLKSEYKLSISGYIKEVMDDDRLFRTEFDSEGELHEANIEWLLQYSVEQIKELQDIAHSRFNPDRKPVELMCPKCGEKREIEAEMDKLGFFNATVVTSKDGKCYIDWDNYDASGDFNFRCKCCYTELASDLREIEDKLKLEKGE